MSLVKTVCFFVVLSLFVCVSSAGNMYIWVLKWKNIDSGLKIHIACYYKISCRKMTVTRKLKIKVLHSNLLDYSKTLSKWNEKCFEALRITFGVFRSNFRFASKGSSNNPKNFSVKLRSFGFGNFRFTNTPAKLVSILAVPPLVIEQ